MRPQDKIEVFGAATVVKKPATPASVNAARLNAERSATQKGASLTLARTAGAAAKAKALVTPRAGFVVKQTPGGRKITAMVTQKIKGNDHKSTIKNAKDVGKRAIAMGNKVLAKLKANKVATKKPAPAKPTAVHGLPARPSRLPVRRLAVPKKGGPARVHLTAAQMKKVAEDAISSGKALQKKAGDHEKVFGAAKGKQTSSIQSTRRTYSASGTPGVRIQGSASADLTHDIVGAEHDATMNEAFADILVGQLPDPSNPGYLTDGSPDPNYYDPSLDPYDPGAGLGEGPPYYGCGEPPTSSTLPALVEGLDYESGKDKPMDRVFAYTGDLPIGAIPYDKSLKPLPWQGIGSYTRFYPNNSDMSDGHGPSGFQWGGGDQSIMDGWYWWWHGATAGTQYKHENAGNALGGGGGMAVAGGSYGIGNETMQRRQQESMNRGWGPLIGNPNNWTKGLRYDSAGDRWFWFYDEAPAWAKQADPLIGDDIRLQKAIVEFKTCVTAAAADAAAQALQDQLDQAEAAQLAKDQAKEDAALQRQYEQEQQQMEHEASLQAVADQTAMAQQQQQLDLESQAAERQAAIEATQYEQAMRIEEERQARESERQAREDERMLALLQQMEQRQGSAGGGDEGASYEEAAVEEMPSGDAFEEDGVDLMQEVVPTASMEDIPLDDGEFVFGEEEPEPVQAMPKPSSRILQRVKERFMRAYAPDAVARQYFQSVRKQ